MKRKFYHLLMCFFVMTGLFLSPALAQTISEPVKSGERNFQVSTFINGGITGTASPGALSGTPSKSRFPENGNANADQGITRINGRHSMALMPEELAQILDQTRSPESVQQTKAPTDAASILLVATIQVGGSVQLALTDLGYTYDYISNDNWTGIDFSPYDVVIIAMDGGSIDQPSLLKIRTDVIDAGKRVIFIGGTCRSSFALGVNQYLVTNDVNDYCWSISAQPQFTVNQPDHDLAQGLASPWNFVNNSAGYYALRANDPDLDVVAMNGDNWPSLFYKGDNWPNVKGTNTKGGGDLIWFSSSAYEQYWSNPSDFALLKQVISNSILYSKSCIETVLLVSTTTVDNSVKKALNELGYTYGDIYSLDWTGIDFSPYDVVFIAMNGGTIDQPSLLKIRTDVIDAGKRVIFVGGSCYYNFASGVNQYLVSNDLNNYCWSISQQPQLTIVQPGHWLAEDVPSPYNFANNSTGYYALRANDPYIDIVAMNGDNWPNLFYKNGNWPGSKDNKAKAVGDLIWFTNVASDDYWSNPSDFALLKQVIENCLSCELLCSNPNDGGTIAASQTICNNATPEPLTQTVPPGGTPLGALQYKWQQSSDGVDFSDITPLVETEGFAPPALTANTWYKRLVKVDCETEWEGSNVVEVTVGEQLTLSCPDPITVNNDEGVCGASVDFSAIAGGTPTPTLTYTLNGTEISSPYLFEVGTHTVVVTAENDCGILSCTFTVTVNDNEPPTIACPEDITVNNDEGVCGAVVTYDDPVVSDNCSIQKIYFTATVGGKIYSANADGSGAPTLLYDPDDGIPTVGPVGIEADLVSGTLYWGGGNSFDIYKAPEDGSGTVSTIPSTSGCCEHHDLELDLINGKIYYTLDNNGLAVSNLDGSGGPTFLTSTRATSMALDRINNKIYFARPDLLDGINVINTNGTGEVNNFIAAGDQVRGITIDEDAGRLYWADMGSGKIYTAKADGTETPYILYDAGASGNVYGIDYNAANGLLYWTVFNTTWNSTGPDYVMVAPADGSGTPTVLFTGFYGSIRGIAAGRNIHSADVSVLCTPPSGSIFPVGTTTVECVATDPSGNSASCTFTVTVNDNEPPVVNTQNITVDLDEFGIASITTADIDNVSTDNCGAITMTLDITEFDCSSVGINTVTLTVKDFGSRNTGNVLSGILGHWTFEPGQQYTDLTGNWGQMNLFGNATVSNGYLQVTGATDFVRIDNYSGPTIVAKTLLSWVSLTDLSVMSGSAMTIDRVSSDHFDGIVYGERQAYRWMSGSSSFQRTQNFVPGYAESTPNQLLMIAITYQDMGAGNVLITGYHNGEVIGSYTSGNMGSWSAGDAEIWMGKRHGSGTSGPGQLSGKIYESQLYGRALSADEIQLLYNAGISGPNQSSNTATVTVVDNIMPAIVNLPADISKPNDTGDCGADVTWTEPTSDDNCSGHNIAMIFGSASGSFFAVGTHTITYEATDASGNTVSESFTITVTDNEVPDVLTKNITIQLDVNGNATIVPGDIDNGSTDNCPIDTYELDKNTFTPADKGNNIVTLTVTDIHGNDASNTANVYVQSLPAPWKECDTHGSANGTGDYDFDPTNPTFNLTATGLSSTLNDVHHFVYQEMCGNQVTVIARLAEVENGGWAGVMMRESCSPGAKTILFKTRLYNPNVIIGYRTANNTAMRNLSQVAQLIRWMKIQRNGSNFKVFTSYNGTTWQQRYSGTISMGSCIQAGIFTESVLATRTSEAWFDHVKVEYGLKSGDEIVIDETVQQFEKAEIELYPNPANDQVTISIAGNESEVSYSITDLDGRVIGKSNFTGSETVLDVSDFKPGLYVIRIEIGGEIVSKRLVVI